MSPETAHLLAWISTAVVGLSLGFVFGTVWKADRRDDANAALRHENLDLWGLLRAARHERDEARDRRAAGDGRPTSHPGTPL